MSYQGSQNPTEYGKPILAGERVKGPLDDPHRVSNAKDKDLQTVSAEKGVHLSQPLRSRINEETQQALFSRSTLSRDPSAVEAHEV
jgi:hypothetical protein